MAANEQDPEKKQGRTHLIETLDDVERIADLFQKSGMDSLEMECGDLRIAMTKPAYAASAFQPMPASPGASAPNANPTATPALAAAPAVAMPAPAPVAPEASAETSVAAGTPVKAPLVGVYYAASSPDAEAFATVGRRVKRGQTVCIIEAMKVMNEIPAPCDGTIVSISAENATMVAFDQVLMTIEA
jgi:acetyl-CoA carboxylase biotin carboxyl carrier protein